jgi:hypothetical protein
MYHADTEKKAMFAFDFDPENATLKNERTLAVIPGSEGGPTAPRLILKDIIGPQSLAVAVWSAWIVKVR